MKIESQLADGPILTEVGARIARRRLDLGLSQAEVAESAGLSKRTVERIEAGESTQFLSFVRVLRVLDLLGGLETMLPGTGPRPLDLLQLRGKARKRASAKRVAEQAGRKWRWGDE